MKVVIRGLSCAWCCMPHTGNRQSGLKASFAVGMSTEKSRSPHEPPRAGQVSGGRTLALPLEGGGEVSQAKGAEPES